MRNWNTNTWGLTVGDVLNHKAVRTAAEGKSDYAPSIIHFETKKRRQERRAKTLAKRAKQRKANIAAWVKLAFKAKREGRADVAANILQHINKGYD
jgi:hypothetical protein